MNIRGKIYRIIMKIAHKYNWHYAPPIYPDGDTQLWCKWCGFRQTIRRRGDKDVVFKIKKEKKMGKRISKKDLITLKKMFGDASHVSKVKAKFNGTHYSTSFKVELPKDLEDRLWDGAELIIIHPKKRRLINNG